VSLGVTVKRNHERNPTSAERVDDDRGLGEAAGARGACRS